MNVPTYLTLLRVFISPIFLLVYTERDFFGITPFVLPFILLFLWGISELSDAFDGYLARKYDQVTDFGKILDPMADSIYRISVLLTFTQAPVNLHVILIFAFLYRDLVIGTLRTICALKGFTLAARTSGKIKATIQAIAIFIIILLLIPHAWGYISTATLQRISTIVVSIAALHTLFSGAEYLYANRHYVRKMLVSKGASYDDK